MSNVVILDYGSGNLRSAAKAFERVVYDHDLGFDVLVSDDPEDVLRASHVVLPGQGAFGDCMAGLQAIEGMIPALEAVVLEKGQPFLGICVGMQLLVNQGFEHGAYDGLGWIDGEVIPISPAPGLKIPHMGWNSLLLTDGADHVVLRSTERVAESSKDFYFVHSFMVQCKKDQHILVTTEYGGNIAAVIGRDNIIGMQFHPEKSHDNGLALIADFLKWKP